MIPLEILQNIIYPVWRRLSFGFTRRKPNDALAARKRFAFEEVFHSIGEAESPARLRAKSVFQNYRQWRWTGHFQKPFFFYADRCPGTRSLNILADFGKNRPIRLLEGDVGSGKTFVAAAAAYATVVTCPPIPSTHGIAQGRQDFGNLQVAYMAPTEILARQHFESFTEYFAHLPINIGLITGSGCLKFPSKTNTGEATKISRGQLLKWVVNGEIPILIGTHALIQKTVRFKHLAFVVIDEQHRFGVTQRQKLIRKGEAAPHCSPWPPPRFLGLWRWRFSAIWIWRCWMKCRPAASRLSPI